MSNEPAGKLAHFRAWCEHWNTTVTLVVGLIGVPGILIAAFGLWLQYDQLIDAERDTARQFEVMTKTLSAISTQTGLQVKINTREASARFFERRNDPLYDTLFERFGSIDFETASKEEIDKSIKALEPNFEHFESTWREVLDCVEPYCKVFDMLHRQNTEDICNIASEDADKLLKIIERQPNIESEEQAYERIQKTVLGDVMCKCPSDWTSWGTETSPFCWEAIEN